jgi:hypothetical protein
MRSCTFTTLMRIAFRDAISRRRSKRPRRLLVEGQRLGLYGVLGYGATRDPLRQLRLLLVWVWMVMSCCAVVGCTQCFPGRCVRSLNISRESAGESMY